jgi:hypothetical protein
MSKQRQGTSLWRRWPFPGLSASGITARILSLISPLPPNIAMRNAIWRRSFPVVALNFLRRRVTFAGRKRTDAQRRPRSTSVCERLAPTDSTISSSPSRVVPLTLRTKKTMRCERTSMAPTSAALPTWGRTASSSCSAQRGLSMWVFVVRWPLGMRLRRVLP